MNTPKDDTLSVPGARLYYSVRGKGRLLLTLTGGDGDADSALIGLELVTRHPEQVRLLLELQRPQMVR
jgi:hypothetical protein